MNQWKGRNEVSTSDGGPMIGRDESNPSVFKTAKLKEYPRDLSAGLAQTMIDQIARLHRLGSKRRTPSSGSERGPCELAKPSHGTYCCN